MPLFIARLRIGRREISTTSLINKISFVSLLDIVSHKHRLLGKRSYDALNRSWPNAIVSRAWLDGYLLTKQNDRPDSIRALQSIERNARKQLQLSHARMIVRDTVRVVPLFYSPENHSQQEP